MTPTRLCIKRSYDETYHRPQARYSDRLWRPLQGPPEMFLVLPPVLSMRRQTETPGQFPWDHRQYTNVRPSRPLTWIHALHVRVYDWLKLLPSSHVTLQANISVNTTYTEQEHGYMFRLKMMIKNRKEAEGTALQLYFRFATTQHQSVKINIYN